MLLPIMAEGRIWGGGARLGCQEFGGASFGGCWFDLCQVGWEDF